MPPPPRTSPTLLTGREDRRRSGANRVGSLLSGYGRDERGLLGAEPKGREHEGHARSVSNVGPWHQGQGRSSPSSSARFKGVSERVGSPFRFTVTTRTVATAAVPAMNSNTWLSSLSGAVSGYALSVAQQWISVSTGGERCGQQCGDPGPAARYSYCPLPRNAVAIELIYPDGSVVEFPDGTTGLAVAESIGPRLAKAAVAVAVDGVQYDLERALPLGGKLEVIVGASDAGRAVIRHSAAHILAQSVLRLFRGAAFAIGPSIDDGFYYDFDVGRPFTPEDLEAIEAEMGEIVAGDQRFEREELSKDEALAMFADQPYKLEIIESVDPTEVSDVISIYRNDDFVDLCRGPHLPSTGRLGAFKLQRIAGAYWRGDQDRPQLQRIYGTAWEDAKALEAHLNRLAEAERRDHRRLGKDLDLFSFPTELGSGLAVWHPKGGMVRKVIEDYSSKVHMANGYEHVVTPHVAKADLWQTSGHVNFYAEGMYPAMELDDGDRYFVKPMNCPGHILIYQSRSRSYRELPLRLFEMGTVYRYERSGVVSGLLRTRGFTVDDSHIFCTRDQLPGELGDLLRFVVEVLGDFGFEEFEADLSTIPEKFVGEPSLWEIATESLAAALVGAGIPYQVAEGEGAFYGPKIDMHIRDALGRRWQLGTIQVDFAQPENFDINYVSPENRKERPVMIHRALLGSIERFFAILVEHYAGAFPMWLAPIQAAIVPVADRHAEYAAEVKAKLGGLRVDIDASDETVGEKIRRALTQKVPAVLVVGDRDVEDGTVGLRLRGEDEEARGVQLADASSRLIEMARPPR